MQKVKQSLSIFEEQKIAKKNQLKKSSDLEFLKNTIKLNNIYDKPYWSLYENNKPLPPLKFSNNKTQENIVEDIFNLIKKGRKVIFLHGVCGTGKSAIALNLARVLGKTSIVVPVKALQKQYENDYTSNKYLIKPNGEKLKIAMITGRENHDSLFFPGKSCADPFLPDTIKITEKNKEKLNKYYKENPFITTGSLPQIKRLRRISIAPTNPYWSPILPVEIELNQLTDAKKKNYIGLYGKKFVFYHRKKGCSYYDQYLSYLDSDVIIFNSAKYLAEMVIGRKPETEVDIIDECDEFLDSLSNSIEINLTRLAAAFHVINPENELAEHGVRKIVEMIGLEEQNKKALGVDENKIFPLRETRIASILNILLKNIELEAEIELDEMNYANTALEAAKNFEEEFADTFLTYRKEEEDLYVRLVTTNLARKFRSLTEGNKVLVLMSGTLHSEKILKHIYSIEDFSIVEAETLNQGSVEIIRTGKEFNCSYSNLNSNGVARENYLKALDKALVKSEKPTLVHVNAFKDLPTIEESYSLNLSELITKDLLLNLQMEDKKGELISEFKQGKTKTLFTTKCSRGIDFPGEMCKSIIFTKYPNPNVRDTFWKILQKTHPNYYWEFYRDKAMREFLQRIYRAVRSRDDHVFILSPDIRVLDAVRELQNVK